MRGGSMPWRWWTVYGTRPTTCHSFLQLNQQILKQKSSVSSPSFKFQEQPSLVAYDGPALTPGWMCESVQRPPVLPTFFIFHLETMPSRWSLFLHTYPILLFLLPFDEFFPVLPVSTYQYLWYFPVLPGPCRKTPGSAPRSSSRASTSS